MTGHHVPGTPTTVEARTAEIAALYAQLFPAEPVTSCTREGYEGAADMDDEMLWAQMIGGFDQQSEARFALFQGDTAAYANDHSSADLALVCHLAWWTNYDAARIDRMFRQSKLYRPKWERRDYRERTIRKALARPEVIVGEISYE